MKRRLNLSKRTYQIALAGIATGLILLFLWLKVIVRYGSLSFYILCSAVLMVPLSKRYYISAIFSYVASSLLAFAVLGDILSVIGFVAYFGPMTIASVAMAEKNLKLYITMPIKIIYINAALAVFYFVTNTIFIAWDKLSFEIPYVFIALIGTVALLVLDLVMLLIYSKLKPALKNALGGPNEPKREKEKDNIFPDEETVSKKDTINNEEKPDNKDK